MNESKNNLDKFLSENKRKAEKEHTHTAIPNYPHSYGGSYTIPDNKYSQFLKLYYNSVFRDKNIEYLTEKHLEFSPVLIDLDFRFPMGTKTRKYDEQFIIEFMNIYMSEVKKILDLGTTKIEVFVLEKKNIKIDTEKNIVKDGIHIMIPNLLTIPRTQYILRYRMLQSQKVKQLLNKLEITNTIEDVIDICVIEKNNWQMYGSTKPNCESYQVTKLYDYTNSKGERIDNKYTEKEMLKILSIRNKDKTNIKKIKDSALENFDNDFNSMPSDHKTRKQKKTILRKKKKSPSKINSNETEDLSKIETLVDILDEKRANDYALWINLGWCLHNIDDRLLPIWIKFSKKSSKFKHGECENEWEYMDSDGLGIGTLFLWAKEDNYGKYKEITSNDLYGYLCKSLSATPYDVAMVLYQLYKTEFVYAKGKIWYQFKNHRWNTLEEAMSLKQRLSKNLVKEYQVLRSKFMNKQQDLESDDPKSEDLEKDMKKCSSLIYKLKETSFKKNVLAECQELFYVEGFESYLDNNSSIIGFENGIYDLRTGRFRDGMPEDYVTYSTRINYETFEHDDIHIQEVRTFIHQVIPITEEREYLLTLLSSFLDGKITGQKFHIWTGSGSNGKSKLIELFQSCFGQYCGTFPSSLITQKRTAPESCNPVLVSAKGKRFIVLQEPEGHEKINVGLMKELTGGDKIIARGLHKDPIEYIPQFKLVLTCNDLPQVPSNDDGTWRRMRCIKFPSKFTYEPNPENPYEFPIDEHLSEKLAEWPEAFIFILLDYYKTYKRKGIYEPTSVKQNTQAYKNKSDQFSQFFGERIKILEKGSKQIINIDEAYYNFQEWFKLSYGNVKSPSRRELETNMDKKFGKPIKQGSYVNVTWYNENDNENSAELDI